MVSVARRNLFQEKAGLFVSIGGVAFALLLVLTLDGLVAGGLAQVTAYIDNTGADVYVAQSGVRTMHMSTSALPLAKAEEIRSVDGVARVAPILYTTNAMVAGDKRSPAFVIGFDPAENGGGPWRLSAGSSALDHREAVINATIATKLGVRIGDEVLVLGAPFRIRGLSVGTSNLTGSVVFVRFDDFAQLSGQSDTASYLLVWLANGVSTKEGLRRINSVVKDVETMSRTEFAAQEGRVVRDMTAEIMVIMNSTGFLIGLAAAGLTVYTVTLSKTREYGVLKAIGASNRWLYRLVLEQAFWSVLIGAGLSVALAFALSFLIPLIAPTVSLVIASASVIKVLAAAAVISVAAAGLPVRQIAGLDPAAVFRQ